MTMNIISTPIMKIRLATTTSTTHITRLAGNDEDQLLILDHKDLLKLVNGD
jgi:hypothetical protein